MFISLADTIDNRFLAVPQQMTRQWLFMSLKFDTFHCFFTDILTNHSNCNIVTEFIMASVFRHCKSYVDFISQLRCAG